MSDSNGRERGILTLEDREFLRGEREHISQGSKYNTRRRIRQRIEDAILDFSVLFEELDDREREQIFGPRERFVPSREFEDMTTIQPEESVPDELKRGLIDAVAFLYGASQDAEMFPRVVIEEGVREAYVREHPDRALREVDLTVEWDSPEDLLDAALYNLQEGRTLSPAQLRALMESDDETISDDELLEIREHVREQSEGSTVKRGIEDPTQVRIGPPLDDSDVEQLSDPKLSDALADAPTLDDLEEDPPDPPDGSNDLNDEDSNGE